ncbi:hydrolase [Aquimarina agarivorans]|uniref:hydrolase n=1 Tax=Aquimarina agarivorans TaxID=980584 RepID=UPI000248FC6C|nr:hydrolase [Aquimarina agarivorans]
MKNSKIFIYLFGLAVLYILFQHRNASKKIDLDSQRISKLEKKLEKAKKVADSLDNETLELSYFTLRHDEYASEYIEDLGITVPQIEGLVLDALIENNSVDNDNPLVPVAGMSGPTRIDRVKLINHKWAIADFTDSEYWGQVLYKYDFSKDRTLSFETIASHIYPKH